MIQWLKLHGNQEKNQAQSLQNYSKIQFLIRNSGAPVLWGCFFTWSWCCIILKLCFHLCRVSPANNLPRFLIVLLKLSLLCQSFRLKIRLIHLLLYLFIAIFMYLTNAYAVGHANIWIGIAGSELEKEIKRFRKYLKNLLSWKPRERRVCGRNGFHYRLLLPY